MSAARRPHPLAAVLSAVSGESRPTTTLCVCMCSFICSAPVCKNVIRDETLIHDVRQNSYRYIHFGAARCN